MKKKSLKLVELNLIQRAQKGMRTNIRKLRNYFIEFDLDME
jgi:hypothetical protein